MNTKLFQELLRHNQINSYVRLLEQNVPMEPTADLSLTQPTDAPAPEFNTIPATQTSTAPTQLNQEDTTAITGEPQVIDVDSDPDVEKLGSDSTSDEVKSKEMDDSGSEELDITDLVSSQKNIESKQTEYFDNLFTQLKSLEDKVSAMDSIMDRLNNLDAKIEKYRERTPEEKLELRSYDSYPFNQKLSDFFVDKQAQMRTSGKNEYVLTSDEVSDINPSEIKNSFFPDLDQELSNMRY